MPNFKNISTSSTTTATTTNISRSQYSKWIGLFLFWIRHYSLADFIIPFRRFLSKFKVLLRTFWNYFRGFFIQFYLSIGVYGGGIQAGVTYLSKLIFLNCFLGLITRRAISFLEIRYTMSSSKKYFTVQLCPTKHQRDVSKLTK